VRFRHDEPLAQLYQIDITKNIAQLGPLHERNVEVRRDRLERVLAESAENCDIDTKIGQRKHGWSGNRVAWAHVALMSDHADARMPVTNGLDVQCSTADVDLGKVLIDKRINFCDGKAPDWTLLLKRCDRHVVPLSQRCVSLLSFGILNSGSYGYAS
jgi:hypothetical protein